MSSHDSGKITPTDHGDKYQKHETEQRRHVVPLRTDQISYAGPSGGLGYAGQSLTMQALARLAEQSIRGEDNTHASPSVREGTRSKASSLGTNNTDTDAKGSSHSMTPIEPIQGQGQNMDFMFSHMGAEIGDTAIAIGEQSRRHYGVLVSEEQRLGPSLSSDFEWSLFKDHGYVDIEGQADKVKMIKPPDRNCDRLGYAFFYDKEDGSSYGHLQDLKLAEWMLKVNFTFITNKKQYEGILEKGDLGILEKRDLVRLEERDLVIFRDPETSQISAGC